MFNLPKPRAICKFDLSLCSIVYGIAIAEITRPFSVLQILIVILSFIEKDELNLSGIYRSTMFACGWFKLECDLSEFLEVRN